MNEVTINRLISDGLRRHRRGCGCDHESGYRCRLRTRARDLLPRGFVGATFSGGSTVYPCDCECHDNE